MGYRDGIGVKIKTGYFEGQLLVATPQIQSSCFSKSLVYMVVHNDDGAMGVIVNQAIPKVQTSELVKQLDLNVSPEKFKFPVHFGGPVEPGRGFVLHSSDYDVEGTLSTHNGFSLTSNMHIFEDIAAGRGPKDKLVVLGYAGWGPGQLENEVEANSWFTVPPSHDLVFYQDDESKWLSACRSLGVDPYMLSDCAGHA